MRHINTAILSLLVAATLTACGGGEPAATTAANPAPAAPAPNAAPVSLDKSAYPVFPDADAGADPAVSAEQGGRGFTGEGWETNLDYDLIGDPRAVKGGTSARVHIHVPGHAADGGPGVQHVTQLHDRRDGVRGAARTSPDDDGLHSGPRLALASLRGRQERIASASTRTHAGLTARPSPPMTWWRRGSCKWTRGCSRRARSSRSASSRSPLLRASTSSA